MFVPGLPISAVAGSGKPQDQGYTGERHASAKGFTVELGH
jgi:hypothetical protein